MFYHYGQPGLPYDLLVQTTFSGKPVDPSSTKRQESSLPQLQLTGACKQEILRRETIRCHRGYIFFASGM